MRSTRPDVARSEFAGFRYPAEVITLAVRRYLRYNLSYRDLEELLAERGIEVDHTSIYRWVARFTPLFIEAARPCRHVPDNRWQVDETYVKSTGLGTTCTALSTSSARSSTSTRASVRTGRRPAGYCERPWPPAWRRWR
jgi:hypothetical protein